MAEGGKGLKKKVAGQPVWAWAAELGGVAGVYYLYKRYTANVSSAAATGTTSGLPAAGSGVSGTSTNSTPTQLPNVQAWIQDALQAFTPGNGTSTEGFLAQLTQYLNGNCVASTYATAITNAITTLGLPPGYGVPTLSICSSSTGATNKTPAPEPAYAQTSGGPMLNASQWNILAHTPIPQYASIWGVLGWPARINYIIHTATPGVTAKEYGTLSVQQRLLEWVQYGVSHYGYTSEAPTQGTAPVGG